MHAPGRNSMCRPYKKKYKDQIRLEEPVAWCFAQERRERDTYKMNILAPVKKADEIEYLVACGATEWYCGYIPQIWIQTYMDVEDMTCSFFRIYRFMITIFIYKEKMLEDKSDGKFPKDKILP